LRPDLCRVRLGVFVQGWLALGWACLLFAFFDLKSRREEVWLLARFPLTPTTADGCEN
jgi:hypothetical protein